jgi:hypothetical protein
VVPVVPLPLSKGFFSLHNTLTLFTVHSTPYVTQIEAARSSLSASFETLRESVQDTHAYRSLKSTVERAQLSAKNTRIVLRQIRLVSGGLGLGAINSAPGEGLPTWPITVFLFTAVCALGMRSINLLFQHLVSHLI